MTESLHPLSAYNINIKKEDITSLKYNLIKLIFENKSLTIDNVKELTRRINENHFVDTVIEGDKKENTIEGGKRKQSKYNIFMKNELERLKKLNPNKDHKLRFKEAVSNWNKKNNEFDKMVEECRIEGLKIAIKKFLGINNKELNILINNNQVSNLIKLKRNALKNI